MAEKCYTGTVLFLKYSELFLKRTSNEQTDQRTTKCMMMYKVLDQKDDID